MYSFQTSRGTRHHGFTLIELLVVVSIIGILTTLLIANMVGVRERGKDAKIKNDLREFKSALQLYYNDHQSYPLGDNVSCSSLAGGGGAFQSDTSGLVYMKEVPSNCTYKQMDSGDGFLLHSELNNEGDKDIAESKKRCGIPLGTGGTTSYYECGY